MSIQEFNALFAKNLNYLLQINNMTQAELANKMNVSTATTSNWCKGIKLPRMDKVDKMCTIFGCYRSDLMEYKGHLQGKKESKGIVIPVLGRVAAGIPIEAIEDIIDTEEISVELAKTGEFFGLKINGDSMTPDICNGDIVIVRQQDDAESGDIVIAAINGDEATCKRLRKYKDGIELISSNPSYSTFEFSNKEIIDKPVKILGRVVESRRKF